MQQEYRRLRPDPCAQIDVSALLEPALVILGQIYHRLIQSRQAMVEKVRLSEEKDYTLQKVLRYIDQRYAEPIKVSRLAAECRCSPSYVSHLFKRVTGMSIPRYVNEKRIEIGKRLLRSTDYSVREVAAMVGFGDPNYFTRTFGATVGTSPSNYRKGDHS